MSIIYDNWERLVAATLKREQLRDLAYCESFSSIASDFSCDSFRDDVAEASRFPSKTNISSYSGKSKSNSLPTQKAEILSSPNAMLFSYQELMKATGKFRSDYVLEHGGFGLVFKGWINECTLTAAEPGSGLAIAVKMLRLGELQDHGEWLKEVEFLGQLCHPNLFKLIGYCSVNGTHLLVYEFMQKGSLSDYLSRRGLTLSWDARIKVATGVARGLLFLHDRDSELIHGDVKSSNILLDGDFSAKLSGFTLTELPPPFDCHRMPGAWSPRGSGPRMNPPFRSPNAYIAPEYICTDLLDMDDLKMTTKCDVYSFGVVLLELLCGFCASESKLRHGKDLVEWARLCLASKRKSFGVLMDPTLRDQYPKKTAASVAALALLCVSSDPEQRPCMKEVLGVLEKIQGPKTGI